MVGRSAGGAVGERDKGGASASVHFRALGDATMATIVTACVVRLQAERLGSATRAERAFLYLFVQLAAATTRIAMAGRRSVENAKPWRHSHRQRVEVDDRGGSPEEREKERGVLFFSIGIQSKLKELVDNGL